MCHRLLLVFILALTPVPVLAHKVIFSVFKSGDVIEGELGFSNGDMAVGQVIEVFDTTGAKLGDAVTDEDGFFVYAPTEPVTHVFKADMGAGHVGEVQMAASDVAALLGVAPQDSGASSGAAAPTVANAPQAEEPAAVTIAALTEDERAAIAKAVRDEMRPLRREIAAYREKNDFQTILGGIGYIFGLFGLGFYLAARRRLAT
ncbi:cobalt ABC transporter permease [Epibacterium sp. MM17-32]|nr:cobalt ABC transporter permease [Epibacterium sp. MM17-32]